MYDRKANEKERRKKKKQKKENDDQNSGKVMTCDNATQKHINQVKAQANAARTALHEAKDRTAAMRELSEDDPDFDSEKLKQLVEDEEAKRRTFRQLTKIRDRLMGRIK